MSHQYLLHLTACCGRTTGLQEAQTTDVKANERLRVDCYNGGGPHLPGQALVPAHPWSQMNWKHSRLRLWVMLPDFPPAFPTNA